MKPRSLILVLLLALAAGASAWTPQELWEAWPEARFVEKAAPCIQPARLHQQLRDLAADHPERLRLEVVGHSVLGRPIYLLSVGTGPRRVLFWSQMHGDEPSATPALLDLADFLLSRKEPEAELILNELTLHMVPMLNPDGAADYRRRNAQAIDVNRDALNLATPEGRLLKSLRDLYEPILGFNLHDQNRRTSVGESGVLATISVLAVSGDAAQTLSPGRRRAKRACAAVVEAVSPFYPGGVGRYDEDFNPRAFGDNITAWGTPVVLIESGGLPQGRPFTDLTRLNFVAILRVLEDLARDDLASHDPALYDELPRNTSDAWVDRVARGGRLLQPGLDSPYRADLAWNRLAGDRRRAGCAAPGPAESRIVEVGDARHLSAGVELDATGAVLIPAFQVGVRGWQARRWLTREGLLELAELGIAVVHWEVSPWRWQEALRHVAQVNGAGRAQIQLAEPGQESSWLILSRLPDPPDSSRLADWVKTIADAGTLKLPLEEALRILWVADAEASSRPPLRPGEPASFLLLRGTPSADFSLQQAYLEEVWLDGVEVRGADPSARKEVGPYGGLERSTLTRELDLQIPRSLRHIRIPPGRD